MRLQFGFNLVMKSEFGAVVHSNAFRYFRIMPEALHNHLPHCLGTLVRYLAHDQKLAFPVDECG